MTTLRERNAVLLKELMQVWGRDEFVLVVAEVLGVDTAPACTPSDSLLPHNGAQWVKEYRAMTGASLKDSVDAMKLRKQALSYGAASAPLTDADPRHWTHSESGAICSVCKEDWGSHSGAKCPHPATTTFIRQTFEILDDPER